MARQRILEITESLDFLQALEDRLSGSPLAVRARTLRLLKENPTLSSAEVAALAESSERSVQRLITDYRKRGLAGVIGDYGRPAESARSEVQWQVKLRAQISTGRLSRLSSVRHWLEEHAGLTCSRSETRYIIRRRLGLTPAWIDDEEAVRGTSPLVTSGSVDIARFLNALPIEIDTREWIIRFRDAMMMILPGVDRIVFVVNPTCKIMNPDEEGTASQIIYTYYASSDPTHNETTLSIAGEDVDRPGEQLLRDLQREGRPLHEFHPPHVVDYYYDGKSHLGTMILLKRTSEQPIGISTLNLVDRLEPFIIYAMANHVAWRQRSKTGDNPYRQAIRRMTSEANLTRQEKRIAIHLMAGHPQAMIAHDLNISVETVKVHVRAIHRKTGTRKQVDLLTKYLSPFVLLSLPED